MTSIAFFRNLNQGQRGSPATSDLVEAFRAAGAQDITAVGSNGTVLFSSDDPDAVAERVAGQLLPWHDQVVVRETEWLAGVLGSVDRDLDAVTEVTMFEAGQLLEISVPHPATGSTITRVGPGFAVVVNHRQRQSNGTPAVERLGGRPATSRSVTTLRRVLRTAHENGPPPSG